MHDSSGSTLLILCQDLATICIFWQVFSSLQCQGDSHAIHQGHILEVWVESQFDFPREGIHIQLKVHSSVGNKVSVLVHNECGHPIKSVMLHL